MLNIRFFARKHFSPFQYAQKQHVQNFFGSRQHGLPTLQIADLMNDTRTLHAAQSEAVALLAEDPLLERPEHALLARQVEQMFDKAGTMN